MKGSERNEALGQEAERMLKRWFGKHYPLTHTSVAYVGAFGVWDVAGTHQLFDKTIVRGRTEQLRQLRDEVVSAIDAELERRAEPVRA